MIKRALSGVVYVLILIAGILYSGQSFNYLMIGFCCICLYEYGQMTQLKFQHIAGMVLSGVVLLSTKTNIDLLGNDFQTRMSGIVYITILLSIILACLTEKKMLNSIGMMVFGMIYIIPPFYLSYDFNSTPKVFICFFLFLMVNDTFAYLIGKQFGKRKLAPNISPKKTIEGFIGGLIFSILLGILLQYQFPQPQFNWIIIGIIASTVGTIGDLVESKIKRELHLKDSSNLIPGHGGFLDRLDSFIFALPFIYIYINY